jgi:amino acid permease
LSNQILVFVVTISVGIQDRPAEAPQTGPWESDWQLIGHPTFSQGVAAVSTLIFACSATSAYFAIVCEMRDPRDFSRSVITAQVISTIVYLIVAVVVYYFCGSAVASPALGSAGPLIKKIAYGLALPGLLVTTTICLHVSHVPHLLLNPTDIV